MGRPFDSRVAKHHVGEQGARHASGCLNNGVGSHQRRRKSTVDPLENRDQRIEVGTRYGSKNRNQHEKPRTGRGGVHQKFQPWLTRAEALCGYSRSDHNQCQKGAAHKLSREFLSHVATLLNSRVDQSLSDTGAFSEGSIGVGSLACQE